MSHDLPARSISRTVAQRLPSQPAEGMVMAVFERACLLLPRESGPAGPVEPLALVTAGIGDGPLNVVIDGPAGLFAGLEPGAPATLGRAHLRAGGLRVSLDEAQVWEPCLPWPMLRAAWPAIRPRLDGLRRAALAAAPAGSLLTLLDDGTWLQPGRAALPSGRAEVESAARHAAWELAAGWAGDGQALVRGARHLAGLGSGLTPAGDDWLAGFMLRAWLAHPHPVELCQDVCGAATPRTTTLAAALLRAAAAGEGSAPWHTLLNTLADGQPQAWTEAMNRVLAHGQTSGADMLAGFLWNTRDVVMSKE